MTIHDLTPEARAAVAEWLRLRAVDLKTEAHDFDPHDAREHLAQAEALEEAASDLTRLDPPALPHGIELRSSRLEALPQILRAAADALETAAHRRDSATIVLPADAAASVVLCSPAGDARAEQRPACEPPCRSDGAPVLGPVEVLHSPAGHCYPAAAHAVDLVDGVERFRRNRIVDDLCMAANERRLGPDMNQIARQVALGIYTREEMGEFCRLTGYSLCGFADVFPEEAP